MIEDLCSEETAGQPRSIFIPKIAPLGTDAFSPDHLFQRARLADFAFGLERARDEHVTDLTRIPVGAAKELTVEDDACADSRPDAHKHKVAYILRRAQPSLAQGGKVDVIVDGRGNMQCLFQ